MATFKQTIQDLPKHMVIQESRNTDSNPSVFFVNEFSSVPFVVLSDLWALASPRF